MVKNSKPLHLGRVLDEVYMKEMDLNQPQLAAKCNRVWVEELWLRP